MRGGVGRVDKVDPDHAEGLEGLRGKVTRSIEIGEGEHDRGELGLEGPQVTVGFRLVNAVSLVRSIYHVQPLVARASTIASTTAQGMVKAEGSSW